MKKIYYLLATVVLSMGLTTVKAAGDSGGVWSEGFENGMPSGWVANTWSIADLDAVYNEPYGAKCVTAGEKDQVSKLITPKLRVQEGDVLSFDLAKNNISTYWHCDGSMFGSICALHVYYSADRAVWTQAKEIMESELSKNHAGDLSDDRDSYEFTTFTVDNIPAGEYYIAFEGQCVWIDNVTGLELIPGGDYDFYIQSYTLQASAKANYEYKASLTAQNLTAGLEAGSYTAKLVVDGEAVAEAEAPAFDQDGILTFDFSYMPHVAGEYQAYIELSVGDYVARTAEVALSIAAEVASEVVTVGEHTAPYTSLLVYGYSNCTYSQTIYTAERLNAAGLMSGSKIMKIAYDAKNQYGTPRTGTASVWIEETEDAAVDKDNPRDLSQMTQAKAGQAWATMKTPDYVEMLAVEFDEPFVYHGGNLRIAVKTVLDGSPSCTFKTEASTQNATIYKYASTDEALETAAWTAPPSGGMPVIKITTEKEVLTVSGAVTLQGDPVADAKVTAASPDGVEYYGATDADGNYTISVFQADKEYDLTAVYSGDYYSSIETVAFEEGSVTGKNITLNAKEYALIGKILKASDQTVITDATVTLKKDGEIYGTPQKSQDWGYGFSGITLISGAEWTLSVKADGYESKEVPVTFNPWQMNGENETELDVELQIGAGISAVGADGLIVVGGKGYIEVQLQDAADVRVYSAAGALVRYLQVSGATRIDGLARGIYVVNGRKVAVK